MIESIMYFAIGFLVAALIGLIVITLVHGRAVRLTMRRLEAATPLSMAEIQADKDQLRAEFAMTTRRLEMSIEQLKSGSASQLAELGKKGDAINQLKIELGEKSAAIFALEARDKETHDQLRATGEELAAKTNAVLQAERTLSEKEMELHRLIGELDERSNLAEAQKVEIATLKTEIDALRDRLTAAGRELKAVEDRRDAERLEFKTVTQELVEERGKVENFGRRVAELEQQLATQKTELAQTREERARLARELAALKRETEEAWATERVENALLRERVSDVAAEVARLASALEGPNSPIDTILATEIARDKSGRSTSEPAQDEKPSGEAGLAGGNLADRIRALQSHASRLQHNDKPTRN
jgi:chromosome segregation ATPase